MHKEDIQKLVNSVLNNTTVEYESGHQTGTSDTYKCSQCGASVRCRDVKNATLSDLDHDDDCAYIIASKLQQKG